MIIITIDCITSLDMLTMIHFSQTIPILDLIRFHISQLSIVFMKLTFIVIIIMYKLRSLYYSVMCVELHIHYGSA
jgi:hypothetical protein